MSDIFPKWTNTLPQKIVVGLFLMGTTAVAGVWYYFSPHYARVGYQPVQPVAFSHAIHAGQLGLDCRYCHDGVEKAWYSNVPTSSVCMNCHSQVLANDSKLSLVRESFETGKPVPWVQVHKKPDYVYFNHAVHVNRGVSCVHCHGKVNEMDEVYHAKSFSMTFCLECHRQPENYIREVDKVYDLNWSAEAGTQPGLGKDLVDHWNVQSSQNCSACHR